MRFKERLYNIPLKWNVWRYDINTKELKQFNIFSHSRYNEDIREYMYKYIKKQISKDIFIDGIRKTTLYYFWGKAEYEIIISPLIGNHYNKKTDIKEQLELNWDRYIEYLLHVCDTMEICKTIEKYVTVKGERKNEDNNK